MGYKIDRQAQALICRILAAGGNLKVAAQAVGCTDRAIYAAKNRDPEFEKQMLECMGRSQYESLITLAETAKENGNLAYKRLRMLYPDDYARAADTIAVKNVDALLLELVKAVNAVVEDDTVMQKILRCFSQIQEKVSDHKAPKHFGHRDHDFNDEDLDDDLNDETLDHGTIDAPDDRGGGPNQAAG